MRRWVARHGVARRRTPLPDRLFKSTPHHRTNITELWVTFGPLGVNAPVAGTGTGHTTYRPDRGSTRHDRPADCRPIPTRTGSRLVPGPVVRDRTVAAEVRGRRRAGGDSAVLPRRRRHDPCGQSVHRRRGQADPVGGPGDTGGG